VNELVYHFNCASKLSSRSDEEQSELIMDLIRQVFDLLETENKDIAYRWLAAREMVNEAKYERFAKRVRFHASKAREDAEKTSDPKGKEELLAIAANYDRLGKRALELLEKRL
jgi:hypothetical protein